MFERFTERARKTINVINSTVSISAPESSPVTVSATVGW
ncbi:hypothetical protein BH24ACT22_BH24ACT22_15920 [soil metagenome]